MGICMGLLSSTRLFVQDLYEIYMRYEMRGPTCKLSRNSLRECSAFRPSASDHFLLF